MSRKRIKGNRKNGNRKRTQEPETETARTRSQELDSENDRERTQEPHNDFAKVTPSISNWRQDRGIHFNSGQMMGVWKINLSEWDAYQRNRRNKTESGKRCWSGTIMKQHQAQQQIQDQPHCSSICRAFENATHAVEFNDLHNLLDAYAVQVLLRTREESSTAAQQHLYRPTRQSCHVASSV